MPISDVTTDPFNLHRFIEAQNPIYASVLSELRNCRKRTHWMWFVFPQITGLGYSSTSKRYAIKSLEEAQHYLVHPILGQRLIECSETVLQCTGCSAWDIFGSPDDMKLRSSMTLFSALPNADAVFAAVLDEYFEGDPDPKTLELMERVG